MPAEHYVLTLSCPDKQGIVHAVSSYLFMTGCNIEDSQQFGDHDTGLFFMRVAFSAEASVSVDNLRASFSAVGDTFRMDWQIHRAKDRMRILLMVSKFGHCLNDLLFRSRTGALPVEIAGSELVSATGRLLEHSRAPGESSEVLRDQLRRELRVRYGVPPSAPLENLIALVADRSGLDPARVATAIGDGPVTSEAELVAVARAVASVHQEVLR